MFQQPVDPKVLGNHNAENFGFQDFGTDFIPKCEAPWEGGGDRDFCVADFQIEISDGQPKRESHFIWGVPLGRAAQHLGQASA